MTNDIKISRELAERLIKAMRHIPDDLDGELELTDLLAAPVVERQEPVAWIVTDMNGDSYFAYDRQTPSDKPLYTSPTAPVAVALPDVDALAQIIRTVDGNHSLGAGALAERIIDKVKEMNQ